MVLDSCLKSFRARIVMTREASTCGIDSPQSQPRTFTGKGENGGAPAPKLCEQRTKWRWREWQTSHIIKVSTRRRQWRNWTDLKIVCGSGSEQRGSRGLRRQRELKRRATTLSGSLRGRNKRTGGEEEAGRTHAFTCEPTWT